MAFEEEEKDIVRIHFRDFRQKHTTYLFPFVNIVLKFEVHLTIVTFGVSGTES